MGHTKKKYYTICSSVYPGKYEPLPEKEKYFENELVKNPARAIRPIAYVSETATYYKVEIPVHGFSKDDIFLTTNQNVLSVMAINKPAFEDFYEHIPYPQTGKKFLQQDIELPDNVDAELAIAEYRDGLLTVFLYKYSEGQYRQSRPGKIAIY